MKYFLWLLPIVFLLLSSCSRIDFFEKDTVITNYEWSHSNIVKGKFNIIDTASLYNIFIVLRHTDAYKYNNIWLDLALQPPGDSLRKFKFDLSLGNDALGWEGTGLNDIWETRKRLTSAPIKMDKIGPYNYQIGQIMRDEPLKYVMSVGIRIEKAH